MAWLSARLDKHLKDKPPQGSPHCLAVTHKVDAALEFGLAPEQIFTIPEGIGGRYSVWSASGLPLCIGIGYDGFKAMLAGAAVMDSHFLTAPIGQNMPVILGLLGIWYNNFLHAPSHAVIPYCERLGLFVDYLQQLEMESNGKSATLSDGPVAWATGPIVWGQTGTGSQHAFFQLLHQGTHLVPVDFIGIINDKMSSPEHHKMLLANMIGQAEALMVGQADSRPHRHHEGNNPSSTLLLDALTPHTLGMLLALYEHKVFVQSAIWDINPFDQWGVELGKQHAMQLLAEVSGGVTAGHDPSTLALIRRAGLQKTSS